VINLRVAAAAQFRAESRLAELTAGSVCRVGGRDRASSSRRRSANLFLAILAVMTACASAPIEISPANPLRRCEYSTVGGRRMWEHVNVVSDDGTFLTIEYPNRERDARGAMQHKKVQRPATTIGPCKENIFTPAAPPAEFGAERKQ
jgi:hypothetical protein